MGFIVRPSSFGSHQLRGAFAGRSYSGFLVRPSAWETQHARGILQGRTFQLNNGGLLPNTPMWRMLEFRYSVNAARFTYFHPNVARMIEQKLTPPPVTPPPVTPPITPPPPTVIQPPVTPPITPPPAIVIPPVVEPPPIVIPPTEPPPDGGQIITPPAPGGGGNAGAVPEPGAFAMLLVAMVVLGAFCLHATKRAKGRWGGARTQTA